MKNGKLNLKMITVAVMLLASIGLTVALTASDPLLSDHPFLKALFEKFQKNQENSSPDKVYLHFDKTLYKPGESIWISAYVRDARSMKVSEKSDIVYVELINPRGAVEKSIRLIAQNGQAVGDFQIAANAKGGTYKLKAYTKWQKNTNEVFEREIQVQAVVLPNLNMRLEFERDAYGPGVQANAQLSLESLDKQPLKNHDFNFVASFDGKETLKGSGKTDEKGIAKVSLNLPATLTTNDALLNVMFTYKGQTESISRSVPLLLGNIDLQFFPEGGELVAGQNCALAFKALDEFGKAADVSGEILDEKGKKVADFSSYHKGMGKFTFRPAAGKEYTAKISQPANTKGSFKLPKAETNAIAMRVRGQNRQEIQVDVLTNSAEELFVVAQTNGNMLFSRTFEVVAGSNALSIPSSSFPVGITQITVFDAAQQPRAERLVFVNPHKTLNVKVKSKKERYMPRELVEMDIEVTDERGRPVAGQFSVAVADDKLLTFADDKQGNILAYTLLESDLKGNIEEPNFYFDDETDPKRFKAETDRKIALDNLMMTQGWTRFVWKDIQDDKFFNFAEKGERALIVGKVTDKAGNPVPSAEIKTSTGETIKSDNKGNFSLPGVALYNAINVTASKSDKYPATLTVSDYNQPLNFTLFGKRTISGVIKDKSNGKPVPYANISVYGVSSLAVSSNEKGEYKIEFPENNTQMYVYYGGYSQYVDLNANKKDVIDFEFDTRYHILCDVSTTSISSTKSGAGRPDRVPSPGKESRKKSAENVPMNNIGRMEPEDFDVRQMAGNVDIADKMIVAEILEAEIDFGIDDIKMPIADGKKDMNRERAADEAFVQKPVALGGNYYRAREFYAPKYESKQQPAKRSDFRSTIYWNPRLSIGNDGKASISFYNSDDITQFRVSVEGFGNNGNVGRTEFKYFIQLPVELTAKIPTELLTEDKVFIPLSITNNTDEAVSGQLIVSLPSNLKFITAPPSIVALAAREGKTVFVEAVVSNEPAEGKLSISFEAKGLKDEMTVAMKTRPRGFPVRITHSGDKLKDAVKFNIKDPIAGSLKAKLKVYPNTLDQVMGGMESMLRMPGGCFEQTSSSNYPNILALNYLRETNSSNPALEKRAKEYLEVGYGRLTGYESKGGGFDWWGRDPAHEALTAYGLMQFIDMKSVYPVDQKLIDRTVKWLLGRRDGKGSWDKNPSCLHSWATSEITDAYIVWAMTEAGMGKEVTNELDKSYKDAVKSEDPYLIGLVVNALYNVKDKRADELMRELVKTQKPDGSFMGLKASVVNSTGNSLKIETTGLAALAMMKTTGYMKQLATAVASIQGSKDYYGYGSTQGTVLALKAIIGYTKLSKRAAENGIFAVMVNGKKVISVPYKADQADIVIPDLTPFIGEGEQRIEIGFEGTKSAIPYELELTYTTRMPDNSPKCELQLSTSLPKNKVKMGETVRMNTQLKSVSQKHQPIVMAMIGIPAGLSVQMWQLKELQEKKAFDFYEIFDGYVVLHYETLSPGEIKEINLDLKADIPGQYESPASTAFLYYTQEQRVWSKPEALTIN
jgi:alpha-2-macroglobulin-like protein